MCELCKIQEETGLSDETIMRIVKVVEEAEKAHLEHTVLSILYVIDTPNLKITQEAAARAAEDLDYNGVKVTENIADDWSSMTYTVERAKRQEEAQALKPLKDGEISDDNELAKLFKSLGLEF
jgi:hypothetical protein